MVGTKLENYGVYRDQGGGGSATGILAKEMRGRNITVNAVAPGPVATELLTAGRTPEMLAIFAKGAPLERLDQPEDIAGLCVSRRAGWRLGQRLCPGNPAPMAELV